MRDVRSAACTKNFSLIKATDQSFLHKCHRLHESNRLYDKPRLLKTTFSIRHYAGEVEYDVSLFFLFNLLYSVYILNITGSWIS